MGICQRAAMVVSAFQGWQNQMRVVERSVLAAVSRTRVKKLVEHGRASLISATDGEVQRARP